MVRRPRLGPIHLTVVLIVLTAGLVPTASAVVVCDPSEPFSTLDDDEGARHTFSCKKSFDAVLVEAYNGTGSPSTPPLTPAGFTACLLDSDGVVTLCRDGCGHLLLNHLQGVTTVTVHLPRADVPSLCPALVGTVTVLFADE